MGRKKSEESHLLFPVSTPCFSPYSYTTISDELEDGTYISTIPDSHRLLFFKFNVPFPNSNPTPPHIYMHVPISFREADPHLPDMARARPLRLSSVTLWFGKKTARSHEPQVASPTSICSLHLASLGREVGAGLRSEFNVNDFAKCGGESSSSLKHGPNSNTR